MEELKSLKISKELHTKLKVYCSKEGLKLNTWVEKNLEKIISELDAK